MQKKEKMVPGEMTGKMYPASERAKWQKQEAASLTGVKKDIANAAAKKSSPMVKSIAAMAMKQAPAKMAYMLKMSKVKKNK